MTSLGCASQTGAGSTGSAPSTHRPRPVDTAPRATKTSPALSKERAEAFFSLDSGADRSDTSSRQAGLLVVVRFGAEKLEQVVATCRDPALGSALGGGSGEVLEVALCNGEFWLVSKPGEVLVNRIEDGGTQSVVTRIQLPPGTRPAQSPDQKP